MSNKYLALFKAKKTIEELKKEYKKLILIHHPDRGGKKEEAQEINEAYEIAYKFIQSKENTDNTINSSDAKSFINIFDKLIKMQGLEIDLVGSWIWLSGNTYKYKEKIKKMNFRYSRKHKKWYYFEGIEKTNKKIGSRKTYKQITTIYGKKTIETTKAIAQ